MPLAKQVLEHFCLYQGCSRVVLALYYSRTTHGLLLYYPSFRKAPLFRTRVVPVQSESNPKPVQTQTAKLAPYTQLFPQGLVKVKPFLTS